MTAEPCPETFNTIAEALTWSGRRLKEAGIEGIRLETRLLVAHATGLTPEYVFGHPERALDAAARPILNEIVGRRCRREPMAYIIGEREFWSLPFTVSPDTLIPRPDSETLVEAVLDACPDQDGVRKILDLGTGSGCLLLALLHERSGWSGVGIDCNEAALDVAAGNAAALGLADRSQFIRHDWSESPLDNLGLSAFDLVITNPPYIPDGDRQSLQPEVTDYEPSGALFAGDEGLDAYRIIVPQTASVLRPGGGVFLEIGMGQAAQVSAIMKEYGYQEISVQRDLSGISRCVFGTIDKR